MASPTIRVQVIGDAKDFVRMAKEAETTAGRLEQKLSTIGRNLTVGLTLPLAALGGKAISAASDLSESMNAIGVIFEDAADKVAAFGETAAESAGLSQRAFNEAVTPIGAMLKNMGFDTDEAADAVIALTQRAADLGSTLNMDTGVALDKFRAALAGESEPIRAFGVDVSAAAIELEAMRLGLVEAGEELDRNAKAQAALSIIMRETEFAAGDFANTFGESLPNQTKALRAELENTAAELGQSLLPTMLEAVKAAKALTGGFAGLSEETQGFVIKLALVAAALGPVSFGAGKLIGVFVGLRNAILGLNVAVGISGGGGLLAGLKLLGGGIMATAAGKLGLITGAAYAAAQALRALLGITTDYEAEQQIINKASSARDFQKRLIAEAEAAERLAGVLDHLTQELKDYHNEVDAGRHRGGNPARHTTTVPVMHSGGVVPGPPGADVPIIAQAGETIIPAGHQMGGGSQVINVYIGEEKVDSIVLKSNERLRRRGL